MGEEGGGGGGGGVFADADLSGRDPSTRAAGPGLQDMGHGTWMTMVRGGKEGGVRNGGSHRRITERIPHPIVMPPSSTLLYCSISRGTIQ